MAVMDMSINASVLERIRYAPQSPGVYTFKNSSGEPLYIGKASSLKFRLRSYTGNPDSLSPKIRIMIGLARDIEYLVTDSAEEALILENTLIKEHSPRYNSRLKDDKTYPYIKINLKEDFPKVELTRRVIKDSSKYFGPFTSARSVRQSLDTLNRLFPYRSCTKEITGTDTRACLEYDMHRCLAPCIGIANKEDYGHVIDQVIQFLQGNSKPVISGLTREMREASKALAYERAAVYRDRILQIQQFSAEQKMASANSRDADALATSSQKEDENFWVEVFIVRNGTVTGHKAMEMDGSKGESPGNVLEDFIKQYYGNSKEIPSKILTKDRIDDLGQIQQWLSSQKGRLVPIVTPSRGKDRKLLDLVQANADEARKIAVRNRRSDTSSDPMISLVKLQDYLSLPEIPNRIECYDVSNTQGSNPVASMVVFENGRPAKAEYRRFKIRNVDGIDDYSMMKEALKRRFTRYLDIHVTNQPEPVSNDSWGRRPDLVIIDGGRGHLSAVLEVLLELGLTSIQLTSLAKQEELLFQPNTAEPIRIPHNDPALFLVQRLRDEAHRFAITHHRALRSKAATKSRLSTVPGIGPKRERALLRRFGGLRNLQSASDDDILAVSGVTPNIMHSIRML
jgi:excinuclease ABC subunit C